MNRRTALKWLHWVSFGLIAYFFLVEPDENRADPGGALSTHAGVGMILALVTLVWLILYLRQGLAGRPGPKLPGWAKRVHPLLHKALHIGVPSVVASGAIAGFAAPFAIQAFGIIPINPAIGGRTVHELAQDLHDLVFNAVILLIGAHVIFHLWRHFLLKDNALRIMLPKILHKYL